MLYEEETRLVFRYDAEEVWIEPYGESALRVRATRTCGMPTEPWALQDAATTNSQILIGQQDAIIVNGKIKATITKGRKIHCSASFDTKYGTNF
jgi:alpha-D-xyloside xylohydrolase